MAALDRRRFLAAAACSAVAVRLGAQRNSETPITLTTPSEATGPHMPADFLGLSYEVQQLVDPRFFSAANTGLIREFKHLSEHGVLRLGGNTSEFAYWRPKPDSPEPEHPITRVVEGEPKPNYYAVTEEAVVNLAGFLKASGWTCIYGIGMGTNTPERAAAEAEFAARTLGTSLQYFQIGNEADLFARHLRDPQSWSAKTYLDEWLKLARAITARVPGAEFGLPDVAADASWLTQIADLWPSLENPPHVTTLTHHYYFGGPATNPDVNIPNLLKSATAAKVQKTADTATAAAKKMSARVRMTEGNTCYRGGKPGVSDVFGAALWAADYALLLASNNYAGLNLHGGTGESVANSVGGSLPGDGMLKEQGKTPAQIATYPHPFYTPIATINGEYQLEPVAYGLKFAGTLSGGTFFVDDWTDKIQTAGVNGSAYAARLDDRGISVIVLNKDAERDLNLVIEFGPSVHGTVESETFHAPALDSREATITRNEKAGNVSGGKYPVKVPRASGVRLTVKA